MINNAIVDFEKDLIKLVNESGIPIAVTCLILEKITKEAKAALMQVVEDEKNTEEQK